LNWCQPTAGLFAPDGRIASTLGYGPDQNAAVVAVMANPDAAAIKSAIVRFHLTPTTPSR
jgi:hypothetical protein